MTIPPPGDSAQPGSSISPLSSTGPLHLATPAAPRRSKLPWIIGGAALGALVLIGIAAAIVLNAIFGVTKGPEEVVSAYDRAFAEADCDLYLSITTVEYQESFMATCEEFDVTAKNFVDAYSDYKVSFTSTAVSGETATVDTTESYVFEGEADSDDYTYGLVKSGDAWLIDSVDLR